MNKEYLESILNYEPDTGLFRWKIDRSNTCQKGTIAGTVNYKGYVEIQVDGKKYKAHRLAWLWTKGEWPKDEVDHIDTDRQNNEWPNLREANSSINSQNQRKAHKDSSTGLLGVSLRKGKKRARYTARIEIGGKLKHLGSFDSPEEAHKKYIEIKRQVHPGGTL